MNALRNFADRHPDHDRVHFIADKTDTDADGFIECDGCGEVFADNDGADSVRCAACIQDENDYRRERDFGAER